MDKEPVSKLCDELALQPTVFYRWQKKFFENGAAAFRSEKRGSRQPEQERIERLEKKIQTKDEVLADLMAEHMALCNLACRWPRLNGGRHRFLDYQVPLKAKQAGYRIGKIDLLGVTVKWPRLN